MTIDRLNRQKQRTAVALFLRALSFLMSARELGRIQMEEALEQGESERAHNRQHAPSFYLLIGFATELLLKVTYLTHGGAKPIATFGHDLEKVYNANVQLGWEARSPKLKWLVDAQQTAHKLFFHRYDSAPEEQLVPDIMEAVQILWDFAHQVESEYPNIWED